MDTIEQAKEIKQHILDEFIDGWDSKDPLVNLRLQLRSFDYLPTIYDRAIKLVEGGTFLVYYYDVNQWLDELELVPGDNNLDDSDKWDWYIHILASAISKLMEVN